MVTSVDDENGQDATRRGGSWGTMLYTLYCLVYSSVLGYSIIIIIYSVKSSADHLYTPNALFYE